MIPRDDDDGKRQGIAWHGTAQKGGFFSLIKSSSESVQYGVFAWDSNSPSPHTHQHRTLYKRLDEGFLANDNLMVEQPHFQFEFEFSYLKTLFLQGLQMAAHWTWQVLSSFPPLKSVLPASSTRRVRTLCVLLFAETGWGMFAYADAEYCDCPVGEKHGITLW